MNAPSTTHSSAPQSIHSARLFVASCIALAATSVAFGVVTSMMGQLKEAFVLDNAAVGLVGGATIWGFSISIIVLGPLVDALGMKRLLQFASVCHVLGVLVMVFAGGFWMLFIGGLILSLGNGTVEAACNPLVATAYPNRKTVKLNQFHVWFPGGIVIGGLIGYAIDQLATGGAFAGLANWQWKLLVVLLPTVAYTLLFAGQTFPSTERVQSGVTFGGMFKHTFARPLFLLLLFCMMLTASMELAPGRWMSEAMKQPMAWAGAGAGVLVLAYGNGLMAILRQFAGPVVERLSPTGVLTASAVVSGIGLFAMSYVDAAIGVLIAATVYYVGICYFWPTMLGVVSERVPKSGAMGLAVMGGGGMAMVGLVTTPLMGWTADHYVSQHLPTQRTVTVLEQVTDQYPPLVQRADDADRRRQIEQAVEHASATLTAYRETETLPVRTANALRAARSAAPDSRVAQRVQKILAPAEDHGQAMAFRWVSGISLLLIAIFGSLYLYYHRRGGYQAQTIETDQNAGPASTTDDAVSEPAQR